jgi:phospholipid/cholesterol/gamma-HCH transport system substrate-binding protein
MSEKKMAVSRPILIGLVVIGLFGLSMGLALTVSRKVPARHYTYAKAAFADVAGLRVGDDVRQHSVRIGQVSAITAKNGGALTTLQLDGTRHVYRDATVALRARSSLGQTYVDLNPGTAGRGRLSGRTIAVAATTGQTQFDDVLNVFDADRRKQAAHLLATTGLGAAGHEHDINDLLGSAPSLLHNLGAVSRTGASKQTDLPALLKSSDQLAARFAGQDQQIADLVEDSNTTLAAVGDKDGEPLEATVHELPATLRTVKTAMSSLQRPLSDTEEAMRVLRPAARSLGTVTPALRETVRNLVSPLNKVPPVADQAEPAVTSLTSTTHDLRPLAPKVTKPLATAAQPLSVLAPYGLEAGLFFDNFASTLSGTNPDGGHYVRIDLLLKASSVAGNLPGVTDPTASRNPYPAPGQARRDRTSGTPPMRGN